MPPVGVEPTTLGSSGQRSTSWATAAYLFFRGSGRIRTCNKGFVVLWFIQLAYGTIIFLAGLMGVEPTTFGSTDRCSNQLRYSPEYLFNKKASVLSDASNKFSISYLVYLSMRQSSKISFTATEPETTVMAFIIKLVIDIEVSHCYKFLFFFICYILFIIFIFRFLQLIVVSFTEVNISIIF